MPSLRASLITSSATSVLAPHSSVTRDHRPRPTSETSRPLGSLLYFMTLLEGAALWKLNGQV
ncbi:hypothetical protein SE86_06175 [Acidilobus sp. 7A]|nr:hypothetical protein SE86_06175 [Acidilobus sp. 7A]